MSKRSDAGDERARVALRRQVAICRRNAARLKQLLRDLPQGGEPAAACVHEIKLLQRREHATANLLESVSKVHRCELRAGLAKLAEQLQEHLANENAAGVLGALRADRPELGRSPLVDAVALLRGDSRKSTLYRKLEAVEAVLQESSLAEISGSLPEPSRRVLV